MAARLSTLEKGAAENATMKVLEDNSLGQQKFALLGGPRNRAARFSDVNPRRNEIASDRRPSALRYAHPNRQGPACGRRDGPVPGKLGAWLIQTEERLKQFRDATHDEWQEAPQ